MYICKQNGKEDEVVSTETRPRKMECLNGVESLQLHMRKRLLLDMRYSVHGLLFRMKGILLVVHELVLTLVIAFE